MLQVEDLLLDEIVAGTWSDGVGNEINIPLKTYSDLYFDISAEEDVINIESE